MAMLTRPLKAISPENASNADLRSYQGTDIRIPLAKAEELRVLKRLEPQNVFKLPFDVPENMLRILQQMFSPIILDTTPGKFPTGHPIASAGMRITESILPHYVNGRTCLEIGSNFRETSGHQVHKFDGVDEGRVRDHGKKRLLCGPWCSDGIEKCDKKAEVLLANHSAYDIAFEAWPQIMHHHGSSSVYLTMILPDGLEYETDFVNTEFHYQVRFTKQRCFFGYGSVYKDSTLATMQFTGDASRGYTHSASNWSKYATRVVIRGRYMDVLVERQKQIGPVVILKMTRLERHAKVAKAPRIRHGLVTVYSVMHYAPALHKLFSNRRWWIGGKVDGIFKRCKRYVVSLELAHKVETFMTNRKDSDVDRQQVSVMLSAMIHEMYIGGETLQKGQTCDPEEFGNLVASLLARAFCSRRNTTKMIGGLHKIFDGFLPGSLWGWTKATFDPYDNMEDPKDLHKLMKTLTGVNQHKQRAINFIVNGYRPEDQEVEFDESKDRPVHQIKNLRTPRDLVIDDNAKPGYCFHAVWERFTGSPCKLPPFPTMSEINQLVRDMDLGTRAEESLLPVRFTRQDKVDHAQLHVKTTDLCRHQKFYENYRPSNGTSKMQFDYVGQYINFEAECAEEVPKVEKFIETIESEEYIVHHHCRQRMVLVERERKPNDKYSILNMRMAPEGDMQVWQDPLAMLRKQEHWPTTHITDEISLPPVVKKGYQTFTGGVNLLCADCLGRQERHIYCAIGESVPDLHLAAYTSDHLTKIRHCLSGDVHNLVVQVILSRTNVTLVTMSHSDLVDELTHWQLYVHDGLAPGELVAVPRRCKQPKFEKVTGPTDFSGEQREDNATPTEETQDIYIGKTGDQAELDDSAPEKIRQEIEEAMEEMHDVIDYPEFEHTPQDEPAETSSFGSTESLYRPHTPLAPPLRASTESIYRPMTPLQPPLFSSVESVYHVSNKQPEKKENILDLDSIEVCDEDYQEDPEHEDYESEGEPEKLQREVIVHSGINNLTTIMERQQEDLPVDGMEVDISCGDQNQPYYGIMSTDALDVQTQCEQLFGQFPHEEREEDCIMKDKECYGIPVTGDLPNYATCYSSNPFGEPTGNRTVIARGEIANAVAVHGKEAVLAWKQYIKNKPCECIPDSTAMSSVLTRTGFTVYQRR